MAPMAINAPSFKRTSTTAEFEFPVAKKQNRGTWHHHKPTWNLESSRRFNAPCQDDKAIQSLLSRSIGLALDAVGFEAAESIALESFRAQVEEYMAHFLADVRLSMLSSRRTQAIPQDFLRSLHTHQLSLSSLIPHLDPPVPPSSSQVSLDVEASIGEKQHQLPFFGPPLIGISYPQSRSYIPRHFPAFPSKHTFKATPEVPRREDDPRKIRELAIEEGRLGEEALRRFLGAGSERISEAKTRPKVKTSRLQRDELWRDTMLAMTQQPDTGPRFDDHQDSGAKPRQQDFGNRSFEKGRLTSAVNADSRYWRTAPKTTAKGGQVSEGS